jgi:hypothetical protein
MCQKLGASDIPLTLSANAYDRFIVELVFFYAALSKVAGSYGVSLVGPRHFAMGIACLSRFHSIV